MPNPTTRLLAIETFGRTGSVAALESAAGIADCLYQIELPAAGRTAQTLAPTLAELIAHVDWAASDVDCVAVASGPGSFTGLRIGVTAAKVWAYAAGADLVGVNTLEVLAEPAPPEAFPLWTVLDAQRNELFTARFVREASGWRRESPVQIQSPDDWLKRLRAGDYVTGPTTTKLQLPRHVRTFDSQYWQPEAACVGSIAARAYAAGQHDDIWQLVPNYFRKSAAEEKWDAKSATNK